MRRLGSVRTLFGSLVVAGWITSLALAQLPTGTILGTVRDASGAVIPGVTVTARSTETGATRTALSGEQGAFRLVALPVGGYEVRAELAGFQTQVRNGVTLAVGQEAVLNFAMQVGAIAETVEVTAEAPLVNTTSGTLGNLVNERQVAELPLNGRNYTDLTLLQPGVVAHRSGNPSMSNPGTMFSSNGAPLRSNNYLLDGAMMGGAKDSSSASVGHTSLGVEGIREWQVVTNSFSAEYGMRMGAQMTLVSKGGSNEVHGSLFEYHRDSALDARNFFDYKTPNNQRRLPAFTRNQWGGSLGGPIKKDKLFYFGTFESLKERVGLTTVLNVPGAGCHGPGGATITNVACPQLGNVSSVTVNPVIAPFLAIYPSPNLPNNQFTYQSSQSIDETYAQGRMDWIMSEKDSFFVRYTADKAKRTEPLGFPGFARLGESLNQFTTFGESHTFSPALLGTFRLSFSRPRANIISNQPFTGAQYAFIPGRAIGGITVGSQVNSYGPDNRTPNNNLVRLYTWSADLYYTKGRQTIKFGVLSNVDNTFFDNANFERGSVTFADLATLLAGNYTQYDGLAADAKGVRNLLFQTWGFYAQDDIKARSNLTLNLGFRYEFHTNVSERNGQMSAVRDIVNSKGWTVGPFFQNPSLKGFSPRLGFAWDVRGDGKTSVRGGAAIVYDVGALGGYLSFTGNRLPPFNPQQIEDIPGTLRSIPLVFRPFTITGSEAITGISFDYNLKNPHMVHYNLAVERSLPFGMGLSLAYAGSRGFNLLGSREGNPPLPSSVVNGRPVWTGTEGRLNPNIGSVDRETAAFNSWYNSLQFVVRKQVSRGLQFQSAYTWGKNIDEKGGVTGAESGGSAARGSAIYQWRQSDRGRADWDVAQSWRFNGIYHFPNGPQGFTGKLLNGWWMSGILQAQTGLPFTPSTSSPIRGTVGVPDLAPGRTKESIMKGVSPGCPGVAAGTPLGTPQRWFDPCAFTRPPQGMTGNVGRNTLDGPGVLTLDASLAKDTGLRMLGESGALQFRAEVFNVLNRPNFSRPNRSVFRATGTQAVPATAGQITATDTTSRQIQFALKVLW